MKKHYNIGLVAHDNCKDDLAEWVAFNKDKLKKHSLYSTGTTGRMVEDEINKGIDKASRDYIEVKKLKSGPLGGDQQLGAMIAEGEIDILLFFWDPMAQQPHDVDVKALLRITVLYNIPTASCRSTADFLISSPLFEDSTYKKKEHDYNFYTSRKILGSNP
jgi:methylglyoxal synthase